MIQSETKARFKHIMRTNCTKPKDLIIIKELFNEAFTEFKEETAK